MSDTPRTDAATKPHFPSAGVTVWDYEELRQAMMDVERELDAAKERNHAMSQACDESHRQFLDMQTKLETAQAKLAETKESSIRWHAAWQEAQAKLARIEAAGRELPEEPEVATMIWHDKQRAVVPQNAYLDLQFYIIAQKVRADENERRLSERPRIVCLCGSTRFKAAFDEYNYLETMAGRIVLSVGFFMHASGNKHGEGIGATPEQKIALDALHKQKIDIADEVLVLNVEGYIGESTRSEIEHAIKKGKRLRFIKFDPKYCEETASTWSEHL